MKIAAPFYGEFGWEVALWVPYLRSRVSSDKPLVFCLRGHSHLYEDFAKKIIEVDRPSNLTKVDCQFAWLSGNKLTKPAMHEHVSMLMSMHSKAKINSRDVTGPESMPVRWAPGYAPMLGELWHKPSGIKNPEKERGWVAIHARDIARNSTRNWGAWKWKELADDHIDDISNHVIVVGTSRDTIVSAGYEDMRGRPLEEVCQAISKCEFIVGASSGTMPLANYCGTPCVWWSGNKIDVDRYDSRCWNPWSVTNMHVADSWDPSVGDVARAVRSMASWRTIR